MWDKCIENDPDIVLSSQGSRYRCSEPPSTAEKSKGLNSPAKCCQDKGELAFSAVIAVRLWEFAPRDSDGEPLYKDVSVVDLPRRANGFSNSWTHCTSQAEPHEAVRGNNREIQSVLASDVEMSLTAGLVRPHSVGDVTCLQYAAKGKSTAAIDVVARLTLVEIFRVR